MNGIARDPLAHRRAGATRTDAETPRGGADDAETGGADTRGSGRMSAGPLTFARLKWTSFAHSCVYLSLLICAFAAGNPQPLTFVLGLAHGLLWIFMSLACLTAARLRVVTLRLAVAVAVLGGIAPFFGSFEFIREQRRRAALE